MKKHLLTLTCLCYLLFSPKISFSQTTQDGLMMAKKELCLVLNYDKESWNKYWEGDRLRDNPNIGTFTSRSASFMAAYGINEKINVFAVLPYIENEASAGTMTGLKGVQDLSIAAKYKFYTYKKLRFYGVIGASVPVTDYVPDFLPFSIGLHSKTASARLIIHQLLPHGFHITAQGGYIARSKTNVDRTNYYTGNEIEYSHEMAVPDQVSTSLRVGINKKAVLAEAFIDNIRATTGTDIRRYDMPLPANKMDWTRVGLFVTWHTPIKHFSVNGHFSHVVAGRNVGKVEASYGAQLQYIVDFKKKK
ncbi:transporter [Arcicella aquatica]|uniref:Transporter n=1 Tax=Arcicella aquatica TaxID=217141 RepID=A0ABU5QMJ3_9BACT|nr:transporter [Arcicella aquatica]MEA5258025.1 transporter [Arcicella aquatica]